MLWGRNNPLPLHGLENQPMHTKYRQLNKRCILQISNSILDSAEFAHISSFFGAMSSSSCCCAAARRHLLCLGGCCSKPAPSCLRHNRIQYSPPNCTRPYLNIFSTSNESLPPSYQHRREWHPHLLFSFS